MTLLVWLAWAVILVASLAVGVPAVTLLVSAAFVGGYALGRMAEGVARRERQ